MLRRNLLLIVLLFATILLTVGCAGGEAESGGEDANVNEGNGESTLIYGRGTDTVTLDAHNLIDAESSRIAKNVYETLIDFERETSEVIPELAKDWDVSDDGKTWTFYLEENVQFHDGTDFNAEAVVYNFERMLDENHPQHEGDFSIFKRTLDGVVLEVKEEDEHTVVFELADSDATFLPNLGITSFSIISPQALEENGDNIHEVAVGTGPFTFESWAQNDVVTLKKNENYRVEGLPKLDTLLFKVIPDNSARLTALKNGEIDLMDGLNHTDLEEIKGNDELQILKRPAASLGYLSFNVTVEPFDDVKVRQAINHAINKQGIVDTFYGEMGTVAKNLLPPAIWGYNDDVEGYEYDVDKAKELLKEANIEEGTELEIALMTTDRSYLPQPPKVAEAIKTDLSKVGIDLKIETYEWSTYLEKFANRELPFAGIGRISENGDPDNYLFTILSSESFQNRLDYKNEKVDELLNEAKVTLDREEREEMYREVQELVHADAPTVPLAYVENTLAASERVSDYVPAAIGYEDFANVKLD